MKPTMIIETRYLGPTDSRGARVKAINVNTRKSCTRPWNLAKGALENHADVAEQLAWDCGYDCAPTAYSSVGIGGYIFAMGPEKK